MLQLETIGAYLRPYAHSHTVLKFECRHLLFRDVNVLIEVLMGHELQSLSMYILHLTPELLDLLAMKLPSLDQLYVMFQFVFSSQTEAPVEDIDAQLVRPSFKSTVISYTNDDCNRVVHLWVDVTTFEAALATLLFFVSSMPTLMFSCLDKLDITWDISIFLHDQVVLLIIIPTPLFSHWNRPSKKSL